MFSEIRDVSVKLVKPAYTAVLLSFKYSFGGGGSRNWAADVAVSGWRQTKGGRRATPHRTGPCTVTVWLLYILFKALPVNAIGGKFLNNGFE